MNLCIPDRYRECRHTARSHSSRRDQADLVYQRHRCDRVDRDCPENRMDLEGRFAIRLVVRVAQEALYVLSLQCLDSLDHPSLQLVLFLPDYRVNLDSLEDHFCLSDRALHVVPRVREVREGQKALVSCYDSYWGSGLSLH